MRAFNIVADENMPLVEALFGDYGSIRKVNGRKLCADDLIDADILLVRSVTQVNSTLLKNSRIKFVGSATIGTDHIDEEYLARSQIHFAHAPGCNANSVVQYVLSALAFAGRLTALLAGSQQLAIVGVGNVGSRLARVCEILGINYKPYDPLRADTEPEEYDWVSWEQVLNSDVISLHVPLQQSVSNNTHHLFAAHTLEQLQQETLLINTARGAVVDNQALTEALKSKNIQAILDVWENEPEISVALRQRCLLSTPHIAGYSKQGKEQGTRMIFQAFLSYFKLEDKTFSQPTVQSLGHEILWNNKLTFAENLTSSILSAYPIETDSFDLCQLSETALKNGFDNLRKHYKDRHEYPQWTIKNITNRDDIKRMKALGFRLV